MFCAIIGCKNVRIEGGGFSGRLECQLSDGTWGTVCNRGFDLDAARAVCRQLGYSETSDYTTA